MEKNGQKTRLFIDQFMNNRHYHILRDFTLEFLTVPTPQDAKLPAL